MKLATWLQLNKTTQTDFAATLGVPVSRVNEWVRGKGQPTLVNMAAIERVTGKQVTVHDFVEDAA